jgi:signal transduction histidine kinase
VRSFHNEGGSALQWILHDITERKNLDSMRNDLIAMVYHDLRSPLANVVSSLDVLAGMPIDQVDPSIHALIHIAIRSTERIQRLTNSLLDINRLEAGQPIGNRQVVTPLSLIDDAVEAVAAIAANKDLQLSTDIGGDLPEMDIDADMIRRVLINLLENAVKFTPTSGAIQIGARCQDDAVVMWVKDSGPGISQADQERIFDKFSRLNLREGPRGMGLGLAFCKLAVTAHGGQIWVESSPGDGSSFKFMLPVTAPSDINSVRIP